MSCIEKRTSKNDGTSYILDQVVVQASLKDLCLSKLGDNLANTREKFWKAGDYFPLEHSRHAKSSVLDLHDHNGDRLGIKYGKTKY